jgi:hypothetical protein
MRTRSTQMFELCICFRTHYFFHLVTSFIRHVFLALFLFVTFYTLRIVFVHISSTFKSFRIDFVQIRPHLFYIFQETDDAHTTKNE